MNNEVTQKPTKLEFLATELTVYLSLVAAFFIVMFLLSDRLGNEADLTRLAMSKLHANSGEDFLLTIAALTFVVGILAALHFYTDISFLSLVVPAVLEEMPRAMYLFGANLTAVALIVGIYLYKHPDGATSPIKLFSLAGIYGSLMFVYGFFMRYQLQRKIHGFK